MTAKVVDGEATDGEGQLMARLLYRMELLETLQGIGRLAGGRERE